VPPILTLVDDEDTKSKTQGCILLQRVLQNVPEGLLQRTGLGEVFEDALLPLLSYLPPLTLEQDSIPLLHEVYSSLFLLADTRCPGPMTLTKADLIDKIMRRGILDGYSFAGEHPDIAVLLLRNMILLIEELGMFSVKHLKVPFSTTCFFRNFAHHGTERYSDSRWCSVQPIRPLSYATSAFCHLSITDGYAEYMAPY
jgi:tRNA nucleotidyltransferase (CCA-adding enzyme)